MRRYWYGAALTAAALLLPAACSRGTTAPETARDGPAAPWWSTAQQDSAAEPASGGYFGSGLRNDTTKTN